jgi:hypothetical protein
LAIRHHGQEYQTPKSRLTTD